MSLYAAIRNGGKTNEEGATRLLSKIAGNQNSGIVNSTDFEVTQNATPNMTIDVAAGDIVIPYQDYIFHGWSDAEEGLTIPTADPSNDRIDRIVAYIDLTVVDDTDSNNPDALKLAVVEGTPAGSPTLPDDTDVETEIGAGNPFVDLASILVGDGVTSITDSNITDLRELFLLGGGVRVTNITSSSSPTPDVDTTDQLNITALAAGATFGAPTGTPRDGKKLVIRIKDNGTARTLAWNAAYRAIGLVLPSTTTISKTLYVGMIYNEADSKYDVIAVTEEF